jgi:hypothetical protein
MSLPKSAGKLDGFDSGRRVVQEFVHAVVRDLLGANELEVISGHTAIPRSPDSRRL